MNPLERRGPVCPEDEEARDPEEVHHEDRRHAEQHPHPTRTPGGRKREHRGQVDRRRQEPVARVDHEDLEAVEPEAGTLLQRHGAEGCEERGDEACDETAERGLEPAVGGVRREADLEQGYPGEEERSEPEMNFHSGASCNAVATR